MILHTSNMLIVTDIHNETTQQNLVADNFLRIVIR